MCLVRSRNKLNSLCSVVYGDLIVVVLFLVSTVIFVFGLYHLSCLNDHWCLRLLFCSLNLNKLAIICEFICTESL